VLCRAPFSHQAGTSQSVYYAPGSLSHHESSHLVFRTSSGVPIGRMKYFSSSSRARGRQPRLGHHPPDIERETPELLRLKYHREVDPTPRGELAGRGMRPCRSTRFAGLPAPVRVDRETTLPATSAFLRQTTDAFASGTNVQGARSTGRLWNWFWTQHGESGRNPQRKLAKCNSGGLAERIFAPWTLHERTRTTSGGTLSADRVRFN